MFKKAKLYSLLAIIVASTVMGIFAPSQNVAAQEDTGGIGAYINPAMEKDAKTKAWRASMLSCIRAAATKDTFTPSTAQLRDGFWFSTYLDDEEKNIGYLVEPDNGHVICTEDGLVDNFARYFGWENAFIAACNIGFRPVDNPSASLEECLAAGDNPDTRFDLQTDEGNAAAAAAAGIDSKAQYTVGGELDDNQLYVLYLRTFLTACGTNPQATEPAAGTTSDYIEVIVVNQEQQPVSVWYEVENQTEGKHTRRTDVNGAGENETINCQEIAAAINQRAPAYALWVQGNVDIDDMAAGMSNATGGEGEESTSTCRVDGIGWIVCPIARFLGAAVDGSYAIMEKFFLRVDPLSLDTSEENGLYQSWKVMRDFANILFVIGFLIIVFSQITSFGINNYGIKRALPRLILAAIMVNISYFLCAVMVDISNILGASLKGLLDEQVAERVPLNPSLWGGGATEGAAWTVITGIILTTGVVGLDLLLGVALLVPLLLAALSAILTVVLVLTLRQALIILLVVISPLAFVALLLPNTEDYFAKWRKTFQVMLLLYPIVALLFGASALASKIIMTSADHAVVQLMGLGVSIIPLAITPLVMNFAGGILNRFAGIVNNKDKGWFDNRRNIAAEKSKIRQGRAVGQIGEWANQPNSTGRFGAARGGIRRFVANRTPYGSNNRDRRIKDGLNEAESIREEAYLGSAQGQDARNASKNAQISLQSAQLNTETVRLNSTGGLILQQENLNAETRKKTAEDNAQRLAIDTMPAALATQARQAEIGKQTAELRQQSAAMSGVPAAVSERLEQATLQKQTADNTFKAQGLAAVASSAAGQAALARNKDSETQKHIAEARSQTAAITGASHALEVQAKEADLGKETAENTAKRIATAGASNSLKVQAATSAQQLSNVQAQDKQTYEELAAAGDSDPTLLTTHGVTNTVAAAAQSASFQEKAIGSATNTARSEGESTYANTINPASATHDPTLLTDAGGNVNATRGQSRAITNATAVIERSKAETVKSIYESSDAHGNTTLMRTRFNDAAAANDAEAMRAYADMLSEAGSGGIEQLRQGIIANEGTMSPEAMRDLKKHIDASGSINSAAEDIANWSRGAAPLTAVRADTSMWQNMKPGKWAGMAKSSQLHALFANGLTTEMAKAIQKDTSAYSQLKVDTNPEKNVQFIVDEIAAGRTPPVDPT